MFWALGDLLFCELKVYFTEAANSLLSIISKSNVFIIKL